MKRLHSLDALRGVAALAVVLWHWQHFFALSGTWPSGWQRSAEPLYWFLKPLYDEGWAAVDLFFALSGYVFFWLYADAIRERRVGVGKFALLRFSRLYPLHLVTLLLVATLQLGFHRNTGYYFIYGDNDLRSFFLNLGFVQGWRLDAVQSFNGPAWSVSVEVLLYGLFFILAGAGLARPRSALTMIAVGLLLLPLNFQVARGVIGFFCGGAAFYMARHIAARERAKSIATAIITAALLGWLLVILGSYSSASSGFYQWLLSEAPRGFAQGYAAQIYLLAFTLVLSPLTIVALALHEQLWRADYSRLSFLGDISYSTYMLQFPMQLALALLALRFGWRASLFQSPAALLGFYVALIGIATLSYRIFERPMQNLLRQRGYTSRIAKVPAE